MILGPLPARGLGEDGRAVGAHSPTPVQLLPLQEPVDVLHVD